MTDRQKHDLKQIIYWKNQIAEIDDFLSQVKSCQFDEARLDTHTKTTHKLRFFGRSGTYETNQSIRISEDMFMNFYSWLIGQKAHLEKLVEESDEELVSLADDIRSGEISKEGVSFGR